VQGNVDVNIGGLLRHIADVETDQFSVLAESEVLFDIFVNGVSVFQVDSLLPLSGPNLLARIDALNELSRTVTLVGGVENTINVRLLIRSLAITNEVPEPATIVMLVSGLGVMTGVIKKRRRGLTSKRFQGGSHES